MRRIWLCVLAAIAIGCGSETTSGTDSGTVPGIDSGTTPGADGGGTPETDSGTTPDVDSGTTPPIDSGTTPGTDSGTSPGTDAGTPTGTRDPRLTSDPDANQVACGTATCTAPAQGCCTSLSGQMCTASDGCTGFFATVGMCDGQEDCSSATRCCAPRSMSALMMGTTCAADCGSDRIELCGYDSDCDAGQHCLTCRPNTGPTGPTVYYGLCVAAATTSCPSPYMNP